MKSFPFVAALLLVTFVPAETHAEWRIGASSVDVTPGFPVRLSGFGFRRAESEGVTQKIWAKALAIEAITYDMVPMDMWDLVRQRLPATPMYLLTTRHDPSIMVNMRCLSACRERARAKVLHEL